jgi:hypothetical protein
LKTKDTAIDFVRVWLTIIFVLGIIFYAISIIVSLTVGVWAFFETAINGVVLLFPVLVMIIILEKIQLFEDEIAKLKGACIRNNILVDDSDVPLKNSNITIETYKNSVKDNKKYEFSRDMFANDWEYEQYKQLEDEKAK